MNCILTITSLAPRRELAQACLPEAGVYALFVHLPLARRLCIGRLGEICFSSGYYIYVGRALRGLATRVGRHLGGGRVLRWHVDYLLREGRVKKVLTMGTKDKDDECRLNRWFLSLGGKQAAPGFGASDCRCESHLIYFAKRPPLIFNSQGHSARQEGEILWESRSSVKF